MANPAASLPGTRTIVLPREPRRGLFGHMLAVLLQPVAFFRQMPTTRQWVGAALIILVLIGMAEVRRVALSGASSDAGADVGVPAGIPGDFNISPDGMPSGGLPLDVQIPGGLTATAQDSDSSITDTTVTALLAAAGIVLTWILQAIVLLPAPMFSAAAPSIARNLQVAVWASVPLGLLALIQLVYYAVGGEVGQIGVSLLLERWDGYAALPAFAQALLHSLTLQFTLFWLWSLLLLYIGARRALGGQWWAAVLIVLIWVAFVLLLPVLTGAVQPLEGESADATELPPESTDMQTDMVIPRDAVPPGLEPNIDPVATELPPEGAASP